MNKTAIIRVFTLILAGLSIISFITVLSAIGYREYRIINVFSIFSAFCLFLSVFGLFLPKKQIKVRPSDLLIITFLAWVIIPVLLTFPLLASEVCTSFQQALFESISALTTTGATSLKVLITPKSILLWLSLLQFFGGIITLTLFIVVFSVFNTAGPGLHKTFLFTYDSNNIGKYFIESFVLITRFFLIISLFVFLILWVFGTTPFNALSLALTVPVTSGFSPYEGSLNSFLSFPAQILIGFVLIMGTLNVVKEIDFFHNLKRNFDKRSDIETKTFFILLFLLTFLGILFTEQFHIRTFFNTLLESISLLSTSAYDFSESGIDQIPKSFKLSLVLIGGAALSTAGGIKLIRFILLLKYSVSEISRVSQPLSIGSLKFKDMLITGSQFIGIWIYFVGYTAALGLTILLLSLFNINFTESITLAISAISNTGPLYEQLETMKSYSLLSNSVYFILSLAMVFGRLEVLTIFAALMPSLWKK